MITLLIASIRHPQMFVHHPEWDQWEILAHECREQTYRDFEVVVVTPFPEEVKSRLEHCGRPFTAVVPRDTPWRREKLFCICSARNTGLVHARGELIVYLDDGVTFGPDFLERIASWWERGLCAVPFYRRDNGDMDGRWAWFEAQGRDHVVLSLAAPNRGEPCNSGLITYPLEAAVAINGYDEHFDGARGLEDMNWSRRLTQYGVAFVLDRSLIVTAHASVGLPPEIMTTGPHHGVRCCDPIYVLAEKRGIVANRVPYTPEEIDKVLHCMFWEDGNCGYWGPGNPCDTPEWGGCGSPIARRIMIDEAYPETFDLALARKQAEIDKYGPL